jgi:TusA-related sulfurtransferase
LPLTTPLLLSAAPATPHVVDCRGDVCVGPCLAAKKAVASIAVGDTVKIITRHPGATSDDLDTRHAFSEWARKTGHRFLGYLPGEACDHIFIRRGR